MPVLDVQQDLRLRLEQALGVKVCVDVPKKRPDCLVRVHREGGHKHNALIDGPGIGIYCWAPTEYEASILADRVADAMQALRFEDGYSNVEQEACYSDRDPDTRTPRWYLSYTLRTYYKPTKPKEE